MDFSGQMRSETLSSLYVKFCSDLEITIQESVANSLRKCGDSTEATVTLRGCSLTLETCSVLGLLLSKTEIVSILDLTDCVLGDDGAKHILNGLVENKSVKALFLKGNNLRSGAAEVIGRLLRHNQKVEKLVLEWNGVGMWDASFGVMAQGLAANRCLKHLDLRSNQVSHEGASELSAVIKQNHCLESLDLRWNNIGIIGARALLNSIPFNQSLMSLELCGNNIPDDLLKAIENAMKRNSETKVIKEDFEVKTQVLAREVHHLQAEKDFQLKELLGKVEKSESKYKKDCGELANKIGRLQESLAQRRTQYTQAVSKLRLVESELALANQRIDEYQKLLDRAHVESKESLTKFHADLQLEREDRTEHEQRLVKDLTRSKAEMANFELKIADLNRKNDNLDIQLREANETQSRMQTEMKVKTVQLDEQLAIEKQKCRETVRDIEDSSEREMFRLKQEHEEQTRILKDKITKLEQLKNVTEDELSRVKSQSVQDRVAFEDQLAENRQKVRLEEEQKYRQLEDKLRLANKSKEDSITYANQQTSQANQLQSSVNSLTLENESLKRRIEELTQEVANKATEVNVAVMKTKTEFTNQIVRLESENASYQEVKHQNTILEKKVQEKANEITALQNQISSLEFEISRMKDEERQRISMLQSAIHNYCQPATKST
ncbi:leucine-rich repeat-containing protein 45-like [Convolutriloba macropyga]|uniref:leucine-rich repeat-containing protein 45-like n=1 Tax=Convolutriloba macropyga TaxID=536237 RepID=UPI003F524AE6